MTISIPGEENKSLTKELIIKQLISALVSLFFVVFVWNFWSKGIIALGINAFVLLVFILLLFLRELQIQKRIQRSDFIWIVPLFMIALSFLIYDNTFLKVTSLLVFPVAFSFFYYNSFFERKCDYWDLHFFKKYVVRVFSFIDKITTSINLYLELVIPAGKASWKMIAKIVLSIILFLTLAFTIFIPLLSSADAMFASKIKYIYDWLNQIFSLPLVNKSIVFMIFSVLLFSVQSAWARKNEIKEDGDSEKNIDSLVAGIVLGGILLLYLLFLWVQIERLWIGTLPFDFRETESIVKSGFWQLLFLSIINTLIYLFTYRKTRAFVQWILIGFTFASLLLLSSAGQRMFLYAKFYGLSYEKFFASYTVFYSVIMFVWLISRLFINRRTNVLKFLVVLFIWMYALITVLPVEQIIFRTNIELAKQRGARIRLYELTMLSSDVLALVKKLENEGALKEKITYTDENGQEKKEADADWTPWIEKHEKLLNEKKFYERNILNMYYLSKSN